MAKSLRVLSIDYDYFQKISMDMIYSYPDGIETTCELNEIIWAAHYADHKELKHIKINHEEIAALSELLQKQDKTCPILITQSHKDIYDFILKQATTNAISITNIDMHHDLSNNNNQLDCGNWIGMLQKTHTIKLDWVVNPISMDIFCPVSENDEDFRLIRSFVIPTINQILDKKYDIVFLCRSDTWSPPHLDKYFIDIINVMQKHFNDIQIKDNVDTPRTNYIGIERIITANK